MSDTSVATMRAPGTSAPRRAPPAGSVDCHSHIFGPFGRFPPSQRSVYALPDASAAAHRAVRVRLGMAHGVLTQPAPYGADPAAMIAAIAASDGALKGIAVAEPDIDDTLLERWAASGIVGLRFVDMRAPGGGSYPGSIGFDALPALAPRMRALGLHAQLWASTDRYAEALPTLVTLGVPLVLDHFGSPAISRGTNDPGWTRLVDLASDSHVWIKLTLCRLFDARPDFADVRPFHSMLLDRMPDRLIWGSDWPYVRLDPAPDAGRMLDLFDDWTADDALRTAILADNPRRLYAFGEAA